MAAQTLTYKGRTQTIKQWAVETGIPAPTITCRKKRRPGDYEYILATKNHRRNLDKNTVLEQPGGGKITVFDLAKKLGLTYPAVLVRVRKYGMKDPKVFAEKERGISNSYNFKNPGGFRHAKTGKKVVAGTGKRVDRRLENTRPDPVRVVADNALVELWKRCVASLRAICRHTGEKIFHISECESCKYSYCRFAGAGRQDEDVAS